MPRVPPHRRNRFLPKNDPACHPARLAGGKHRLRLEMLEERRLLSAADVLEIPGMVAIDSRPGQFADQAIFLDFDGADGVIYRGPIVVEDIDVAAFQLPPGLAASRDAFLADITDRLNERFAMAGVFFTIDARDLTQPCSTIYVGNGEDAFPDPGRYLGLAEQIDVGNHDKDDCAFVFPEIIANVYGVNDFEKGLAFVIAHEAAHLLGYAHQADSALISKDADSLSEVALSTDAHRHEMRSAITLYQREYPERWNASLFNVDAAGSFGDRLYDAVEDEDVLAAPWGGDDHIVLYPGVEPYLEHFWDPDQPDGSDHYTVFGVSNSESAIDRLELYWSPYVVGRYQAGNALEAWHYLGRVAHLLEDMTVPAHVHLDGHGTVLVGYDMYEETYLPAEEYAVPDGQGGTAYRPNYERWTADDVFGFTNIPPGASSLAAALGLFLTTAEITDDYDSDDVDGEFSGAADINSGEVEASICAVYADTLMPLGIGATASLIGLFVNSVKPAVAVSGWQLDPSGNDLTISLVPDTFGNMSVANVEIQRESGGQWITEIVDTDPASGWGGTIDVAGYGYGESIPLRARTLDAGGLYSDWYSWSVLQTVDSLPPTGDLAIASAAEIDGDPATLDGPAVAIDPSASDDSGAVADMRLRVENGDWQDWQAYSDAPFIYTIPQVVLDADTDGQITVEIEYRDAAGNVSPVRGRSLAVMPGSLSGAYLVYKHSTFDDGGIGAVAIDKTPLFAGQTASTGNISSYALGINGVAIDLEVFASGVPLSASDFVFRVGNDDQPGDWDEATMPVEITTLVGAGLGGATRVEIVWQDHAMENTWLQVTILAGGNSGLAEDEVFYFGHLLGDVGDENSPGMVTAADLTAIRNHPHGPSNPAGFDNRYDINKDMLVNVVDSILARNNIGSPLDALRMISPPSAPAPAPEHVAAEPAGEPLPPAGAFERFDPADVKPIGKHSADADIQAYPLLIDLLLR